MSWEANRWTAKTPAELYHTLGPHGVDELVREFLTTCWRELPAEGRSLALAIQCAQTVFDRNMAVWAKIKKPGPECFFADLQPHKTDHLMRQAMVTCWMMMPRTGGREVKDVRRIVGEIFDRNLAAWQEDDATFTGKKRKAVVKKAPSKAAKAVKRKKPVKAKLTR
ncbi:MAG TPA: hypothetical protein VG269_14925 [Tepidisphaeraceae bacterium]|jgi:hypothetical protein|nr:hypothetical protein [Tepidisphaeraceae bacterium]